jgi:ubiquinone/menaquinone biosynthesis C-methylase UbiE
MRLSTKELNAMSHPLRRVMQRRLEMPLMRRAGLQVRGKDFLEIGCGSGYAAELLLRDAPRSYLGVDLMEEQIELAQRRRLPGAEFVVGDATDLGWIPDESKDVIAIFGILHHIPGWRRVIEECRRILRPGGTLVLEEPDGRAITLWDRLLAWGHHPDALFTLDELSRALDSSGFSVEHQLRFAVFGVFGARRSRSEKKSAA